MSFDHVQGLSRLVRRTGASSRLEMVGSARTAVAAAWAAFAPPDIKKGDLIVVSRSRTTQLPNDPAGYTIAQQTIISPVRHNLYYRIATADAADEFNNGSGEKTRILVFRNHSGVGKSGKTQAGGTTSSTLNFGGATANGSILVLAQHDEAVGWVGGPGGEGWTSPRAPSGDTSGYEVLVRNFIRTPVSTIAVNFRGISNVAMIGLEVLPK